MQKRDIGVLLIAIGCGLLAFYLVMTVLKKPAAAIPSAPSPMEPAQMEPEERRAGSLPIPARMSALTMSSREVENIPDIVEVGGYVDILGVVPNYEGRLEMQTIVRGAQVIELDKEDDLPAESITAAVSPVAAEAVSKALSRGKIRLIFNSESGGDGSSEIGEVVVTEIIRGVEINKSTHIEN